MHLKNTSQLKWSTKFFPLKNILLQHFAYLQHTKMNMFYNFSMGTFLIVYMLAWSRCWLSSKDVKYRLLLREQRFLEYVDGAQSVSVFLYITTIPVMFTAAAVLSLNTYARYTVSSLSDHCASLMMMMPNINENVMKICRSGCEGFVIPPFKLWSLFYS